MERRPSQMKTLFVSPARARVRPDGGDGDAYSESRETGRARDEAASGSCRKTRSSRDELKGEVEYYRRRVAATETRTVLCKGTTLINPRGRYLQCWDVVALIALLLTAVATPFEVSFIRFMADSLRDVTRGPVRSPARIVSPTKAAATPRPSTWIFRGVSSRGGSESRSVRGGRTRQGGSVSLGRMGPALDYSAAALDVDIPSEPTPRG